MNKYELIKLKPKISKAPALLGRYKYLDSAVLIPLVLLDDEHHFVFQKRTLTIRQGGEISFPGGFFDSRLDAGYEETAVRETIEELGIEREKIEVVGCLGTLLAPMGVALEAYVGILDITDLSQLKISKEEVEKVFALPVSFFRFNEPQRYSVRIEVQPWHHDEKGNKTVTLPAETLGLPDTYRNPWGYRSLPIYLWETDEGPIWGMTAELIFEFLKLL